MPKRTVSIDPVTRIEGYAKVRIDMDDNWNVVFAGLSVGEFRGFEKILQGMRAEDMPLITARICGVCPAAHHLTSVKTLERAYNAEPPEAARMLRELMYMGHMIHSHTLSLFLLSGPDLLMGLEADPRKRNIAGILKAYPEMIKNALRLRSIGQEKILERIGGRGVHPVTAVAGGLSFSLDSSLRNHLKNNAEEALELALLAAKDIKAALERFIDKYQDIVASLKTKTCYMGTVKNSKLNFYGDLIRVMDPEGSIVAEFDSKDYADHIVEKAVDWSYGKLTYLKNNNMYQVGALARINVADEMETPLAQKELEEFRSKYERPCHYTLMQHYARIIELIYSCEKAVELIENDAIMGETRIALIQRPENAIAHIEAPRGILVHDYEVNEQGVVEKANLIIATQQNFAAINETIRQCAEYFLSKNLGDELLKNGIEFSIRTYDPCLSCSTHAAGQMPLEINIFRDNISLKAIRRI